MGFLTTLSDTCEHDCIIRAVCWSPIWLPFIPGKLLSGASKHYAKVDMLAKLWYGVCHFFLSTNRKETFIIFLKITL